MPTLTAKIDNCLLEYYNNLGAPYLNEQGIGKFAEWVDENGYDTETISEDLHDINPAEVSIVEFDEDFPSDEKGFELQKKIFSILQACWKSPWMINSMKIPPWNFQQFIKKDVVALFSNISFLPLKLNPDRTVALIKGYSSQWTYFQIISSDIIRLIGMYFNNITYFNISKNNGNVHCIPLRTWNRKRKPHQESISFDLYLDFLNGVMKQIVLRTEDMKNKISMLLRVRIFCVENGLELDKTFKCSFSRVYIRDIQQLSIDALEPDSINIGIEVEVLHIAYEDGSYWPEDKKACSKRYSRLRKIRTQISTNNCNCTIL